MEQRRGPAAYLLGVGEEQTCPFCRRPVDDELLAANSAGAAFPDAYPRWAPGHTLVIPNCHEADLYGLGAGERQPVWDLVDVVRNRLASDLHPDGFNIGVNIGAAAGQTVHHAHGHLIPRFAGDVPDPRGGVGWVLPEAAAYWAR